MNIFEKETAETVSEWYLAHGRDLPWRKRKDAYSVWVSEIMLQQTQAVTVIPYYERFMKRFPDVFSLANAPDDEVFKYWEGLGYYRRASHLKETAKVISCNYNGAFPESFDELRRLKGIGDYTASAVASIAFGIPKGVVDGNVLRIISRLYGKEDNIALEKTKKAYGCIMDRMIVYADPAVFNQAMMDLGAVVCTPKRPDCGSCPLKSRCRALKMQTQLVLPVNIKKKGQTKEDFMTAVIRRDGRYLLKKNKGGMLEHLYGFIQYPVMTPSSFEARFREDFGTDVKLVSFVRDVKHVFTHRIWQMHVYFGELTGPAEDLDGDLYTLSEIEALPVPTAHLKVLKAALKAAEQDGS